MGTSSRFLAESLSLQESTITHQLVLVGCDSCEDSLNEDEGAELLRFEIEQRGSVVLLFYDVDPWLVFVHGVEDDLQRTRRARISLQWNVDDDDDNVKAHWSQQSASRSSSDIFYSIIYIPSLHHKALLLSIKTYQGVILSQWLFIVWTHKLQFTFTQSNSHPCAAGYTRQSTSVLLMCSIK